MKRIILGSLCLFLLVGCQDKDLNDKDNSDVELKYQEMKDKLIEYGKLVYENAQWLNGGVEPGTYHMNLKEMSERNGYDISMFVNPKTDKVCDIEGTKIEFIVKDTSTGEKTDYEFNPVLECGE